jgi:hypothetical protein
MPARHARPASPSHGVDPAQEPAPYDLHLDAASGAIRYSEQLAKGGHLRFPWRDVDEIVGPLLPGRLILWGARRKGGKSTVLRTVFNEWVNLGHRVVFVGTEQEAAILKLLWACERLQLPEEVAFDTNDPRHADVLEDVMVGQAKMADRAILVADPGLTLDRFIGWARYAFKLKARALILDHFHRFDCQAGEEQYAAIREIKRVASLSQMVFLVAAQLNQGEGGSLLGHYEVPGPSSWAGTANLEREADVAIQAWQPFVRNIERDQKQAAREDPEKLAGIVQENVMAIRVSARRYRHADAPPQHTVARLYVRDGMLCGWGQR